MNHLVVLTIGSALLGLVTACIDDPDATTASRDGSTERQSTRLWNRALDAQATRAEAATPSVLAVEAGSGYLLQTDAAWAELGTSVAVADVDGDGFDDLVVGAPLYQPGAFDPPVGRAHVFHGSAAGLADSAAWTATGTQNDAQFGLLVASAGDVDGDGFDDVLVGAPRHDGTYADGGRAELYMGSSAGLESAPAWTVEGEQAGALLGVVAGAGDIDNDGYDDVLVGAPNATPCRVTIYYGSSSGLATSPDATLSHDADTSFGFSAASAGDVNDDGYDDVIVGAYSDASGGADAGRVFVYHGGAGGIATTPAFDLAGDQAGGLLGAAVRRAGDVDADGYGDIVVAAPSYGGGAGRVMLLRGSPTGASAPAAWSADGTQANEWFGMDVAAVGDVDGDGLDDVLIGAFQYGDGEASEGRIALFAGTASGLTSASVFEAESNQANAMLGRSVAGGDFNGDGFADLAGGAPGYESDAEHPNEGAAFVYDGCLDSNLDGECEAFIDGDMDGDPLGTDCDDDDDSRYHGADEVPDDGIDQDCNGADTVTCAVDADLDGAGGAETVTADDGDCTDPGEAPTADDCDDDDDTVFPGADEIPDDDIDQDCDGRDATSVQPPGGGDDGGCGCAVRSDRQSAGTLALIMIAILLVARRDDRRRRPARSRRRTVG